MFKVVKLLCAHSVLCKPVKGAGSFHSPVTVRVILLSDRSKERFTDE